MMEWNMKSLPEWEWENAAIYGGSPVEMGRDLVDNNGPTYSSTDLGIGSSSKNSISTYMYPSSKEGTKNLEGVDAGFTLKNGDFQIPGATSIGSGEPMNCLQLGSHSYFEEKGVAFSVMPTAYSSSPSTKRARGSYQSTQTPRCQVEGCNLDLVLAKDYHRRHRICESHSKSPKVIVAGLERRFCQQCSRFHDLSEFDEKKRSCRRRLSDHNARRRRPQPEAIHFGSTRMSSSLYDQRSRMNFLLNSVPVPVSNQIWESDCSSSGGSSGYRGVGGGDSLAGPLNVGGAFDRKLNFPNNYVLMPNAISMAPRVLNHGSDTSAITTNFNVAQKEIDRALSLLSTESRPLNDSKEFNPLHHQQQQQVTLEFNYHQLTNSNPTNWALSSQEFARPHSSDFYNNNNNNNVGSSSSSSTQFQEFQLLKSPRMSDCFYSNHIN